LRLPTLLLQYWRPEIEASKAVTKASSLSAALASMTGAGLMLGAHEAQADTFSQSQSFSVTSTNGNTSQPVIFDGFNTALGTLEAVDLTLTSPVVQGSASIVVGGEGGGYSFQQTAAVLEPDGDILTSASGSGDAGCAYYCTGRGPFTLDGALSTAPQALSGSMLAQFESGPAILSAALQDYTITSQICEADCSVTSTVTFTGTLDVDYVYTPATAVSAAPEPATWAMMLGGVGLIGLALRHTPRRKELPRGDIFSAI
jgi:hypothetical protein